MSLDSQLPRQMKLKKTIFILCIALIFFLAGYYREAIMVNIGYQEWTLQDPSNVYGLPSYLSFLSEKTMGELFFLRWLFTGIFIIVHLIISSLLVMLLYKKRLFLKWTIIAFAFVLAISMLFYLIFYLNPNYSVAYTISRQLAGIIQSPFLVLVLIPLFEYLERSKSPENERIS